MGRRPRRRYNQDPPARVLTRGLVVVVLLGLFGWLGATLYNGVPGRDYRFVDAEVPRLGNLIPHDPVRLGGVRVGQVRSVEAAPDGTGRLELQIEPGTDIPADTTVRIRANGLLGARFVELRPGTSGAQLAEGQALRGGSGSLTYGVTDALDVLDRETRGALRPMLAELGTGLGGQGGDVNDLLRVGADHIVPVKDLFTTLRGSSGAVDRLLPALRDGLAPLDAGREDLARMLGAGDVALRPFVQERDATRETLAEAPPALDAATAGLSAARPLLASARALSAQARRTLPPAPAALRATRALLVEAREPLRRARPLLREAGPAAPAIARLTGALDPLLEPARGLFGDLREITAGIAPYGCDIRNFGAVFRSMTGFGYKGPGGPNGPAMQFRLQAVAPVPTESLSVKDFTGLAHREPVPEPCRYLAEPYKIIDKPQLLRRGR